MHHHKCHRCKLIRHETCKSYHKRISVSFNLPFICPACVRAVSCVKHPDFAPHVVKPEVKKAKKAKIKSIASLGLAPEIVEAYDKFGKLSIPFLQRKFKMSYAEALQIQNQINSIINEK